MASRVHAVSHISRFISSSLGDLTGHYLVLRPPPAPSRCRRQSVLCPRHLPLLPCSISPSSSSLHLARCTPRLQVSFSLYRELLVRFHFIRRLQEFQFISRFALRFLFIAADSRSISCYISIFIVRFQFTSRFARRFQFIYRFQHVYGMGLFIVLTTPFLPPLLTHLLSPFCLGVTLEFIPGNGSILSLIIFTCKYAFNLFDK